jgi:hypothetical protein
LRVRRGPYQQSGSETAWSSLTPSQSPTQRPLPSHMLRPGEDAQDTSVISTGRETPRLRGRQTLFDAGSRSIRVASNTFPGPNAKLHSARGVLARIPRRAAALV